MYIRMGNAYWNSIKDVIFNSKQNFEEEMYKFIFEFMHCDVTSIELAFPDILTTHERHCIHLFSKKDTFTAVSKGEIPDRFIEVKFSELYIQHIYNRKTSPVVPQIDQEIDTFKKAILDDIMNVVDKHLQELYLKFYH